MQKQRVFCQTIGVSGKTTAVLEKTTAVFSKTAAEIFKTRAVLSEYLCSHGKQLERIRKNWFQQLEKYSF